jgi:hypothetical protein
MPGTQAQNVRWVALEEQLAPARTGVELGLALALALVLELALVVGVVLLEELEPPLLQAARSVIAATAANAVRPVNFISEHLFDISGTPSLLPS